MTTNSFNRSELELIIDSVSTRRLHVIRLLTDMIIPTDNLLRSAYQGELDELTKLEDKISELLKD
jgi:hypothetical protein